MYQPASTPLPMHFERPAIPMINICLQQILDMGRDTPMNILGWESGEIVFSSFRVVTRARGPNIRVNRTSLTRWLQCNSSFIVYKMEQLALLNAYPQGLGPQRSLLVEFTLTSFYFPLGGTSDRLASSGLHFPIRHTLSRPQVKVVRIQS